jgi:hypothetical protein
MKNEILLFLESKRTAVSMIFFFPFGAQRQKEEKYERFMEWFRILKGKNGKYQAKGRLR